MGSLISKQVCPLCKKESEFQKILLLENVFASGDVFEFCATSEIGQQDYARGDCTMDMQQCLECGFIYNFAFDMSKMLRVYTSNAYYQQKYFTKRLSKTLIQTKDKIMHYASKDSVFLEIAPGLCDLLCALAKEVKFVYSIDPSPTTMENMPKNVAHIQGFFDATLLRNSLKHKVDFIVFRHLLEHIEKPREFLEEIVEFLDIGGKIYVEVPNALTIFKNQTFYDFYHDHVSYFTQNTLINVFATLGCECVDSIFPYDEQWMGFVFQKVQNPIQPQLEPVIFDNIDFTPKIQQLNSYLKNYQSISLWGGGIHSNTLLEFIEVEHLAKIKQCVDLNPEKQGRFLQKSQIKIVGLNAENLKEIECILVSMTLHEKVVVQTEITRLLEQGLLPNLKAIILSASELKLIKIEENQCKI